MRKILEVSSEPLIISECWTYYKMSVIQTGREFENWLITHMKLFVDGNGNALFGEDGELYPLSYYCDILNIEDGNIMGVSKTDIAYRLEFQLKMQQNSNTYLIS